MQCVKIVDHKKFHCLKNCRGLQVTSFDALEPAPELNRITAQLSKDYQNFKGVDILKGMAFSENTTLS